MRSFSSPFLLPAIVSYLGEKGGPDWLNIDDLGGGDQSLELLGLHELLVYVRLPARSREALHHRGLRTVISTPSSARIKAA